MFASWLRKASLATLAVAGLAVGSAQAGSTQLGSSGWTASWDSSLDSRLSLDVHFVSSDTVFLEKFVTFTQDDVNESGQFIDPVVIVFQAGPNATPNLVLNDETVTNQTGQNWNGFRFRVLPGAPGVQFDQDKTGLGTNSGFSINPFTTFTFPTASELELGGGVVPTSPPVGPNVWFPGVENGGLYIHADLNVATVFKLEEQPLPGGGNIIPLPAAAWSGLSGLAGLALIGSRKTLKKLFA